MLTREVSQNYLNNALTSMHAARRNCLFETSWALTNEAKLTVSSLGQNKRGSAHVKHKIKSVDRLVGNKKLHGEIPCIYEAFFKSLLLYTQELFILVDWSGCCGQESYMLRASLIHTGRSISIYNEIHVQKKLGNHSVHCRFLMALKKMIPADKQVTIITDSGFLTPWFSEVLKLGWNYIGRLPGYLMIRQSGKDWRKVSNMECKRKNSVRFLGEALLGKNSKTQVSGNIYSYHGKSKNRKEKSKFPEHNSRYQNQNKSPWVLATSLSEEKYSGIFIKNKYANRMQIEQNFRDEKSPRFGFGWRLGRTKCLKRIAILCLLAHIAEFFLISIGTMAEQIELHKVFQVNTKKKRVLSLITLAKLLLKHEVPPNFHKKYQYSISTFLSNLTKGALC